MGNLELYLTFMFWENERKNARIHWGKKLTGKNKNQIHLPPAVKFKLFQPSSCSYLDLQVTQIRSPNIRPKKFNFSSARHYLWNYNHTIINLISRYRKSWLAGPAGHSISSPFFYCLLSSLSFPFLLCLFSFPILSSLHCSEMGNGLPQVIAHMQSNVLSLLSFLFTPSPSP